MIDFISTGISILGGGSKAAGIAESGQFLMMFVMFMMMRRNGGDGGTQQHRHALSASDENAQRTTQQVFIGCQPQEIKSIKKEIVERCGSE